MSPLAGWENFYVIIGSSAGALIGLQFVVVTLIAEMPKHPDLERAGAAFATPTVIHFTMVLLLSAFATAPWESAGSIAILWGVLGVSGLVYSLIVWRRMTTQQAYKPVLEDWIFYLVLPKVGYVVIAASAFCAHSYLRRAEFGVAASALLLLFLGIHNAWDSVTYHVLVRARKDSTSGSP
jgi:hypothetical protein